VFRIGEFAQIAQVSTRQLRFYDRIGLLRPGHTDRQTGYRYYAARQLSRLNAILALKDLGLTLDQIGPLLEKSVSPEEMRGMLLLKEAEAERSVRAEEQRLRNIQSRIAHIERQGSLEDFDIVTKALPALTLFATRQAVRELEDASSVVAAAAAAGQRALPANERGNLVVVAQNDTERDLLDLTVGYAVSRRRNQAETVGGLTFSLETLPAAKTAATLVRCGTNPESHLAFGALGRWIEDNAFAISGPSREIFLDPLLEPCGFETALVEIQFPVTAL
jgi:DNA-binding transcriptional MerR regulator